MKNRKEKSVQSDEKNVNNNEGPECRQKFYSRLCELRDQARGRGIGQDLVAHVFKSRGTLKIQAQENNSWFKTITMALTLSVIITAGVMTCGGIALKFFGLDEELYELIAESRCIVENGGFTIEVARPLTNCDCCRNLKEFPVERNITPEDFVKKYAYTAVPVLIKDATHNWTAMTNFSFDFFKNVYTKTKGALTTIDEECQFFPYKTEFETLGEVFNMSAERANFTAGEKPWYIGWSNCHSEVSAILRQHYNRPYFLPADSESSSVDWMFMGGPGLGAFVHLDYVQRPSWQAQISGQKTWTLIPTPECEDVCTELNVTVSKGDIIVLDTNQWYHATYIHPGEISITIGSEYD
ncbi:uncharacterized protein LOC134281590 [Saccostrea cucullata]|uniref:uncharacterized protein LOC134281590 n=1 Tax=Saccostrea cuccullata TaxID=36930 RepID=UPI002ED49FF4